MIDESIYHIIAYDHGGQLKYEIIPINYTFIQIMQLNSIVIKILLWQQISSFE